MKKIKPEKLREVIKQKLREDDPVCELLYYSQIEEDAEGFVTQTCVRSMLNTLRVVKENDLAEADKGRQERHKNLRLLLGCLI